MTLAPERWGSHAEDERLQLLLTPFIGFLDVTDPDFEPADNIDELLDEAATAIRRATIILREIAQFNATRARRPPSDVPPYRRHKNRFVPVAGGGHSDLGVCAVAAAKRFIAEQ